MVNLLLLSLHMLSMNWLTESICGYDTNARQQANARQLRNKSAHAPSTIAWERRAPYNFQACLAHADVTFHENTGEVKRVVGFLQHSSGCSAAVMERLPSIPIHPHVSEIAIAQLAEGAR